MGLIKVHSVCFHGEVFWSAFEYGPWCEKTCLWGFANNKGADQPAQSDQHLCFFAFWKVLYPILLHANFQVSS